MMVELSPESTHLENLGLTVLVLGTMCEMPGMPMPDSLYTHLVV